MPQENSATHTQSIAQMDLAEVERRLFGKVEYDLYVQEASRMFRCQPEKVTTEQRQAAKLALHRSIYQTKGSSPLC